MASRCFYARPIAAPGERVSLDERESRHAEAVRRLGVGDSVNLIDGAGVLATGRIEAVGRKRIDVLIQSRHDCARQMPAIDVACAPIKWDRQRQLLDMLTQQGIRSYTPLLASRVTGLRRAERVTRWERICLEACKQSGNPWLPEITAAKAPADAVADFVAQSKRVVVADPAAAPLKTHRQKLPVALLIGPEGGFTDDELRAMSEAGAEPAGLGGRVLRVETAAVAAVVTVQALAAAGGEAGR